MISVHYEDCHTHKAQLRFGIVPRPDITTLFPWTDSLDKTVHLYVRVCRSSAISTGLASVQRGISISLSIQWPSTTCRSTCWESSKSPTHGSDGPHTQSNAVTTRMTLSRAHTSANVADLAKLLLLNKPRVTCRPLGLYPVSQSMTLQSQCCGVSCFFHPTVSK